MIVKPGRYDEEKNFLDRPVRVKLVNKKSEEIVMTTRTDIEGEFTFKKVPIGKYRYETDLVGSKLNGTVEFSVTPYTDKQVSQHKIIIKPDYKNLTTLNNESLISEETLLGGDESQVNVAVKGPNSLQEGQVGFYVVKLTTKNFGKEKHVGELPNILDGKIIMASNEKAAVHPRWADLQVSNGKVRRQYYQPDEFGDLAGSGVFSFLGSLGTAGPLATAIDLGDKACLWQVIFA